MSEHDENSCAPYKPLTLTIVTPSYNQVQFIGRTIESVRAQKCANVQHIVVDGGSTDGTVELLRATPGIEWVSEKDRGQTHALNKGIARARGEIVGWINSDDVYREGAFAVANRLFAEDPALRFVYGDCDYIDADDVVTGKFFALPASAGELARRNVIPQPGCFFRRKVFDEVGLFDESFRYAMDYEFWLRIALVCGERAMHRHAGTLAAFRIHGASKTSEGRAKFEAEERRALLKQIRARALVAPLETAGFARDVVLHKLQHHATSGRLARVVGKRGSYATRLLLERVGYTSWEVEEAARRASGRFE